MPLRGSASCSTFDVSTRKVPSLALVPRGHLQHATRAKKKVAGSIQQPTKCESHSKQQDDAVLHTKNAAGATSPSPPRPSRRQLIGNTLEKAAEAQAEAPDQSVAPERHQDKQQEIKEEAEEEVDGEGGENGSDDDEQAELRLGERFLDVMALMARLASQSLGDSPAPTSPVSSPSRLTRINTGRVLSPFATTSSPPQQQAKSPKHAVREVAKRLPRALQGQLTFDICMLLPAPLDGRQSPLHSPVRRKRLRKRVRRRRLRRRPRRTWQASHASWPPHASADYIVDHPRQDIAGISAARLVERLSERKVDVHVLPRVISMPLPPLHQTNRLAQPSNSTEAATEELDDAGTSEDDEQKSDGQDSERDVDGDEEEGTNDGNSHDEDDYEETPLSNDNTAAVVTSSPRVDQEHATDRAPAQARKRPLYHQPAWISPELHAWLAASGLFATKPRHELPSTGL